MDQNWKIWRFLLGGVLLIIIALTDFVGATGWLSQLGLVISGIGLTVAAAGGLIVCYEAAKKWSRAISILSCCGGIAFGGGFALFGRTYPLAIAFGLLIAALPAIVLVRALWNRWRGGRGEQDRHEKR